MNKEFILIENINHKIFFGDRIKYNPIENEQRNVADHIILYYIINIHVLLLIHIIQIILIINSYCKNIQFNCARILQY